MPVQVKGKLIAVNPETGVQAFSDGAHVYLQTPGQPQAAGPIPLTRFQLMQDQLGFETEGELPSAASAGSGEESRLDLQGVTLEVPAQDCEKLAFVLVAAERGFQSLPKPDGWGQQDHHPAKWMEILVEELGEAAKARLEADDPALVAVLDEWTQVAAVAVAAVASMLRSSGITSPADQERFVSMLISRRAVSDAD